MNERNEQIRLFLWARGWEDEYPELAMMYHTPLGGFRHKATAGRLKRQGTKAGVPDIHLPIARSGFHGLWLEMKWGKNKPTKAQQWWIDRLQAEGHQVRVCYSCEEAQREILEYLGIGA